MKRGKLVLCCLIAIIAVATMAWSAELPRPRGRPILVISGEIDSTNKDGTAQFDRKMLEGLGTVAVETTTPWHNGRVRFEGVPLARLMKHVGAKGQKVTAIALNDYSTEIPLSDFEQFGTILAIKRDGEYMPVRDKGPLFVIYPYDSRPELKSQLYYGRSAWQVSKLVIR
jgi:hypothetical protein